MKVIISHDVDHIKSSEHLKDLFLVKYLIRNSIELFYSVIPFSEFKSRILDIFRNKFNNIESLIDFDNKHSVQPTYFIAVNNGLSLSYNEKEAYKWTHLVLKNEIQVGIHGIDFDNLQAIKNEKEKFNKVTQHNPAGIRMHYLRLNEQTLRYLDQNGYQFDSSTFAMINPYRIGNLWEFPVHLMDSYLVYGNSTHQLKSIEQIKDETINTIEKAKDLGIRYFTIITHDFYFSDSFRIWKEWYIWLIKYMKSQKIEFINFDAAVRELNL